MREPRYPLPRVVLDVRESGRRTPRRTVSGAAGARSLVRFSLARSAPGVRCSAAGSGTSPSPRGEAGEGGAPAAERVPPSRRRWFQQVRGSFCWAGFDNDPSAGSPTETLLRLLLPLNDKVQWTSRDVAGSEPPASPRSEHFTGPFNR